MKDERFDYLMTKSRMGDGQAGLARVGSCMLPGKITNSYQLGLADLQSEASGPTQLLWYSTDEE